MVAKRQILNTGRRETCIKPLVLLFISGLITMSAGLTWSAGLSCCNQLTLVQVLISANICAAESALEPVCKLLAALGMPVFT